MVEKQKQLLPTGLLSIYIYIYPLIAAFITAGMLLTAAKFYSAPTNGNARTLFRASLLHLPLFMGAFLLHRLPNTGEDRKELFLDNARRLGLAMSSSPVKDSAVEDNEIATTVPANLVAYSTMYGSVSLPPLPFLPAPSFVHTDPYIDRIRVEKGKGNSGNVSHQND